LGIAPDYRHYMTRRDLMSRNIDLLQRAGEILATKPIYSLSVRPVMGAQPALRIAASSTVRPRDQSKRISRVDVMVNGRPHKSLNANRGSLRSTTVSLGKAEGRLNWVVQAFDCRNNLVASRRR
jgi:hypothetical protein